MRPVGLATAALAVVIAAATGVGSGVGSGTTASQTAQPPLRPGAASNFSQGWSEAVGLAARDLPLARIRDSIRWSEVETSPGRYRFDKPSTTWPDRFAGTGARITLTLNWGNPIYDNGDTPHSPQGLTAFGRFAAVVVQRFRQVDTLEIGNEVNSANFVSGPVKDAGLAERGRHHLAMVRAVAEAVRAIRPEVRVIGGSTHSLPAGFLWPLLDLPGAGAIAGLALHPYTTPIDQLPAQVGFLRRHGPAAVLPLHVTEFGSQDPARAADDLVRGFAMLAMLGATEFDWYPFNERGDGLVPLVRRDGSRTLAAEAYRFVQARIAGRPARDISPDPFTRVIRFGADVEVIWGSPRAVRIDPGNVDAFDAIGRRLDPLALELREDRVLVLVADSFYQFGYPLPGRSQAPRDPFDRLVRLHSGTELPFEPMAGQQRPAVPWTPYLGRGDMPALRLMADSMLPRPQPGGAVIHRYTAPRDVAVRIDARFEGASPDRPADNRVTASLNGRELIQRAGQDPIVIGLDLMLHKGDALAFAVTPAAGTRGELTRYRIRLHDRSRCPAS